MMRLYSTEALPLKTRSLDFRFLLCAQFSLITLPFNRGRPPGPILRPCFFIRVFLSSRRSGRSGKNLISSSEYYFLGLLTGKAWGANATL